MQVYLPRYHTVRLLAPEEAAVRQPNAKEWQKHPSIDVEHIDTYIIPETGFIVYCNKHASDTKISGNPYAKAVRSRQSPLKSSFQPFIFGIVEQVHECLKEAVRVFYAVDKLQVCSTYL